MCVKLRDPGNATEWRLALDRAHQRASGFFRLKAVQVYFLAALRSPLPSAKSSSYRQCSIRHEKMGGRKRGKRERKKEKFLPPAHFAIFSRARANISDFPVNRFFRNDIPVKSNLPTYRSTWNVEWRPGQLGRRNPKERKNGAMHKRVLGKTSSPFRYFSSLQSRYFISSVGSTIRSCAAVSCDEGRMRRPIVVLHLNLVSLI